MNLKFAGDLEGFMQAWDTLIIAVLHSSVEPKLRPRNQRQPAFAVLDGNELLSNTDQVKFLSNSATRVEEHMKAERAKQERLRAVQTSYPGPCRAQ